MLYLLSFPDILYSLVNQSSPDSKKLEFATNTQHENDENMMICRAAMTGSNDDDQAASIFVINTQCNAMRAEIALSMGSQIWPGLPENLSCKHPMRFGRLRKKLYYINLQLLDEATTHAKPMKADETSHTVEVLRFLRCG